MERVKVGNKYRFKKDWSKNYDPIFYSAKRGDIVTFTGKSLGNGGFRNLTNGAVIWLSHKEIFRLLEEVEEES